MPCGCTSACGCNLIEGDNIVISREGDSFTISAIGEIVGVEDSDCIELVIDPDRILQANLILSPEPTSVDLECTADGLEASVVVDPASTAIVSEGPLGLRVDVPPAAPGTGNEQPGDLLFYSGVGFRVGAIDADGGLVARAGYPALHDALSLYATTASRISGDPQITNIPSTRFIEVGMPLEAFGFPFGTVVAIVNSSTSITADQPATTSGNDTEVRVYPHGNGDGISTFNTPDMNDRYPLGYDYIGGTLELGETGGGATTIANGNLPQHIHTASATSDATPAATGVTVGTISTDSGHNHGGSTSGGAAAIHNHEGGTGRDALFVTVEDIAGQANRQISEATVLPGDTFSIPTNLGTGGSTFEQGTRQFTSNDGLHEHTIPTGNAVIGSISTVTDPTHDHPISTVVTVDPGGGVAVPTPLDVDPRHLVGRWMVIV